jgi:hypothetical protein
MGATMIFYALIALLLTANGTLIGAPRASEPDILVLQGQVNSEMANQVEAFQGRKIFVDSFGGSVAAGHRIAEVIVDRAIEVTVIDRCYSACFNFIFLPARVREVRAGATLGFHSGAESSWVLAKDQGLSLASNTKMKAEQHLARLQRAGVSEEIFREAARLMKSRLLPLEAVCEDEMTSPGVNNGHAMCQLSVSEFKSWFPTTAQLERLGILVTGPPIQYRSLPEILVKINIANRDRPAVFGECEYFPAPTPSLNCPGE